MAKSIDHFVAEINTAKPNFVYWTFNGMPEEAKDTKEVIVAAVTRDASCFRLLSTKWKNDREVVLATLTTEYWVTRWEKKVDEAFRYIPEKFWNHREIVLAAVTSNGDALEYANSDVEDYEITRCAVLNSLRAICHSEFFAFDASDEEKKSLLLLALGVHGSEVFFQDECWSGICDVLEQKNFVLLAVSMNGGLLECVSEDLQDDEDVVTAATRNDPATIHYASNRVRRQLGGD